MDQIGQEDAVAQTREVVDVGGRGIADVDYAQAGLGLEPLAQRRPPSGVARHSEPGKAGSGSG